MTFSSGKRPGHHGGAIHVLATDVCALLLLLGALFILYVYNYWKARNGIGDTDTAFFLDVLQNTWHQGLPTTSAVRAFLNVYPLIDKDAAQFCALDFSKISSTEPANILLGHANLIVYPLSFFAQWAGAERIAALATAASFVALPAIAYVFLRKHGVSALLALLFMLSLCLHPAWRISTEGWIYFDRLFMPFALMFALTLFEGFADREVFSTGRILKLLAVMVVGSVIHERGALLMLMVGVAHLALYRQVPRKNLRVVILLCVLLVIYLAVYATFQRNVDNAEVYKNFFKLDKFLQNVFRPGLVKLLMFNLTFIGLAILFHWRAGLIALAAIFPNVIVSIGGAEKDGWITHYHSFYFPFVIYAAVAGLISINRKYTARKANSTQTALLQTLIAGILLAIAAGMAFLNPYGAQLTWGSNFVMEGVARPIKDLYLIDRKFSSNVYEVERADRLVAAIPKGASVTYMPPFNVWKLFGNGNAIQVFPIGTGSSEYLLLTFDKDAAGNVRFNPVGVALDPAEHLKAQQCATNKVWAAGYQPILEINHYMLLRR